MAACTERERTKNCSALLDTCTLQDKELTQRMDTQSMQRKHSEYILAVNDLHNLEAPLYYITKGSMSIA